MSSLAFYKDKNRDQQIFCQFPIGFIYISMIEINPSKLLGGTWEKISGVFLLACSDKYPAKSTGGEEEHKLTIEEMPSHQHKISPFDGRGGYGQAGHTGTIAQTAETVYTNYQAEETGGDKPHNNMPPYLAVYMYQRTA